MSFEAALEYVNSSMYAGSGRSLREPEILVLKGTWQGWTYDQMAENSDYSTNYLMRDIAPKLWKRISQVLNRQVGKTNFKITLELLLAGKSATRSKTFQDSASPLNHPFPAMTGASAEELRSQPPTSTTLPTDGSAANDEENWDTATKYDELHGYDTEIHQLRSFFSTEGGRVISIYGLSGIGKTTLVQRYLHEAHQQFNQVIWRSLRHAPTLTELLQTLPTNTFSSFDLPTRPYPKHGPVTDETSTPSVLLVLDGMESILEPEKLPGQFKSGYENYGEWIAYIATAHEANHIILTSLENPEVIRRLTIQTSQVKDLRLAGLSETASTALLAADSLQQPQAWPEVIRHYQGHPTALKAVARLIQELMNGHTAEFAAQDSFVVQDVETLLDKSFQRLSFIEKEMLYWLASKPLPVSLATLTQDLPPEFGSFNLLSVLDALKQRSLIETISDGDRSLFSMNAMIANYVTRQFIAQFKEPDTHQNHLFSHSVRRQGAIQLSSLTQETINLGKWFRKDFQVTWQSIETLFEGRVSPMWRLRSTFRLKDRDIVKRCKPISLKAAPEKISLLLIVAISQESDESTHVWVQVQSADAEDTLPSQLALKLLSADGSVLASVEAQQNDLFIQLPDFYGHSGEQFDIQITQGNVSHTEVFVL